MVHEHVQQVHNCHYTTYILPDSYIVFETNYFIKIKTIRSVQKYESYMLSIYLMNSAYNIGFSKYDTA